MIKLENQSHGFSISLSRLFEDAGVLLSDLVTIHKFRAPNSHNIVSLRTKGQALNISPTGMLAMEKEIGDEMVAWKKPTKKSSKVVAHTKRKLVLLCSDAEEASPLPLTENPRKTNTRRISSPLAPKPIEAVPLTQVQGPKGINADEK